MFPDLLAPTHLLLIFVVALLVFGPKRLPELGRTLGKGLRDFRGAMNEYHPSQLLADDDEEPYYAPTEAEPPAAAATAQAAPAVPHEQVDEDSQADETPAPGLEPTVDAEALEEHTADATAEHPAG